MYRLLQETGFSKGDGAINKPNQNEEVESVSRHKSKGNELSTILSSVSPRRKDQGATNAKPPPRNLMGTLKSFIPFISRKENDGSEDERKKGGGVKIKALAAAEAARDAELLKQVLWQSYSSRGKAAFSFVKNYVAAFFFGKML